MATAKTKTKGNGVVIDKEVKQQIEKAVALIDSKLIKAAVKAAKLGVGHGSD